MKTGFSGGVAQRFLNSKLTPLLTAFSLVLGLGAVMSTPREEEPQIVVPMADVFVSYPGASAEEVEKLVATPLEKLLWQVDGVEHVRDITLLDFFQRDEVRRIVTTDHDHLGSIIFYLVGQIVDGDASGLGPLEYVQVQRLSVLADADVAPRRACGQGIAAGSVDRFPVHLEPVADHAIEPDGFGVEPTVTHRSVVEQIVPANADRAHQAVDHFLF